MRKSAGLVLKCLFFLTFLNFIFFPKQAYASTNNWGFSSSVDYTFNSDKIEFSSGYGQLKKPAGWYSESWLKRVPITITGSTFGATTDYQLKITVTYDSDMQADFDDIRFTDSDGLTLLGHWNESKTDSVTAIFWVKIPDISASPAQKTIYMYYANSGASSSSSVIDTFIDFDNFDRANLNTSDLSFSKSASNPLTSAGYGDPEIFYENNTFYLFVDNLTTGNIDLFTSSNGQSFTFQSTAITKLGTGFEASNVRDPSVLKIGSTYHMWYTGSNGTSLDGFKIGHATSSDLITWNKDAANPVFSHVGEGVNEPSVIYEPSDTGKELKMLYTAGTGSVDDVGYYDIGYAYSSDGTSWTDSGDVISGLSLQDQEQIKVGNIYVMYLNDASNNVLRSISYDHIHWSYPTLNGGFSKGPDAYDANAAFAPTIAEVNGTYYFYYQSQASSNEAKISLATSTDLSGEWTPTDTTYFEVNSNRLYKKSSSNNSWQSLKREYRSPKSAPYLLETDLNFSATADSGYTFGVLLANDQTYNYSVIFKPSTNTISLWQSTFSEPGTQISNVLSSTSSHTLTANQTYKLRGIVTSTGIQIDFYDGSLWNTNILSYSFTPTSSFTGYYGFGSDNNFYADNYVVRKYISPEPSYTTGTEELVYATDNPTIVPVSSTALSFLSLSGFSETAEKNSGELKYQLSNDSGATWYWYNSGWTLTSSGYTEANTASVINSNISTFPYGSGSLLFKAFLHSDGTQKVRIDSVVVEYLASTPSSGGNSANTSNSSSGSSSNTTSAEKCSFSEPTFSPDLFQIDVDKTWAKLYFSPSQSPIDRYYISYGLNNQVYGYGSEYKVSKNEGVLQYTIYHLSPNATYSFRVRGGNNCAPGAWSNVLKVNTSGKKTFYRVLNSWSNTVVKSSSGVLTNKKIVKIEEQDNLPEKMKSNTVNVTGNVNVKSVKTLKKSSSKNSCYFWNLVCF